VAQATFLTTASLYIYVSHQWYTPGNANPKLLEIKVSHDGWQLLLKTPGSNEAALNQKEIYNE